MIINRKPYPAIKDSGVEWLGAMPAHWKVERTKSVASVLNGATPSTNNPSYWNGDILWLTPDDLGSINGVRVKSSSRKITQAGYASCGTSLAPRGSIVISTRAPIGHLAVLDQPSCVNQGCRLLVFADGVDADYIYYLLLSARKELQSLGVGTTFTELPRARLENFPLALPPLPEQTAIVRFLNHADQRIQRYIRAKQKLITLLEEQKQVIVHEAVTGRIDVRTGKPYPTYKDSGVEWLGEVPTHWEVRRLKSWLDVNELVLSEDTDAEYTFDYLDIGAVETGRLAAMPERIRFADSPSRARRVVRAGDTLVSTVRTYLKAVWWYAGQPHGGLIASTGFAVLTPRRDTYPKFVNYVCQSDSFTNRVTADSVGIAYPAIAETRLGTFKICVPPLPEQTAIARFLDDEDTRIQRAIERTKREIDLLQEYRIRLIADVVTGKLDVREAAAKLPETDAIDDFGGSETAQAESNASLPNNALRKDNIP